MVVAFLACERSEEVPGVLIRRMFLKRHSTFLGFEAFLRTIKAFWARDCVAIFWTETSVCVYTKCHENVLFYFIQYYILSSLFVYLGLVTSQLLHTLVAVRRWVPKNNVGFFHSSAIVAVYKYSKSYP